jgi:hypothetical protein
VGLATARQDKKVKYKALLTNMLVLNPKLKAFAEFIR